MKQVISVNAIMFPSSQVMEQQHLKSLSGSVNTMQHVLEEAGRLLKLVWRVSLPAGNTAGDCGNNQQVDLHKHITLYLPDPIKYLQNQILNLYILLIRMSCWKMR